MGDTSNIVTCLPLDADRILMAAVIIEAKVRGPTATMPLGCSGFDCQNLTQMQTLQALLGVSAVAMPGTVIGAGSTLGAMAVTQPGGQLKPGCLYMGSPALLLMKAAPSPNFIDAPSSDGLRLTFALLPAIQPVMAYGVLASGLVMGGAAAMAGLHALAPSSAPVLATVAGSAFAALGAALCVAGAAVKRCLLGLVEPMERFEKYSYYNLRRMLVHMADVPARDAFAEAMRGSPWFNAALRLRGVVIGRGVYVNTLAYGDYELMAYGDRCVVDQDAVLFAHLGMYRQGKLENYQAHSSIGAGAVVGAHAATLPGYHLPVEGQLGPAQLGM